MPLGTGHVRRALAWVTVLGLLVAVVAWVSTTNDPATPHDAAVRTVDRLESAVLLLTVGGNRHGAIGRGIGCVDEHVAHYLVNVVPPPEGVVCS